MGVSRTVIPLPLPFPQLRGGLLALQWGCSGRGDHVLEEDRRLRSCGPCGGTKAVSGRAGLPETPGLPQAWLLPATHPGPSSLDRPSDILRRQGRRESGPPPLRVR